MFKRLSARGRVLWLVVAAAVPFMVLSVDLAVLQRSTVEFDARSDIQRDATIVSTLLEYGANLADITHLFAGSLHHPEVVTLLDANSDVVAQFSAGPSGPPAAVAGSKVLRDIANGSRQSGEQRDESGVRWVYGKRDLASGNPEATTVVVATPEPLVASASTRSLAKTSLAAISIAILLIVAVWGVDRLIRVPVRRLLAVARRIEAGDFNARTGMKASHDELTQLGAAIDTMAEQLATRDAQLRSALEKVQEQAMTDPLTGLYNRRFFNDAFARACKQADRQQRPFSVVLMDLDNFKKVNDTYGHEAGDTVLQHVAGIVRHGVRASDIAARYGGEEFAILLPDTRAEDAFARAERLRRALQAQQVACGDRTIDITASFGVAECNRSTDGLMQAVDAALYAAKAAGRNAVRRSDASPCSSGMSLGGS